MAKAEQTRVTTWRFKVLQQAGARASDAVLIRP
jgi:hypothetical protein